MWKKALEDKKIKLERAAVDLQKVIEFFQNNKVVIMKLNHCMNKSSPTYYDGFMQLSRDGDYIEITKKLARKNFFNLTADELLV